MGFFKEVEFQEAIEHNPPSTEVGKALHFFFQDHEPETVDWEKLTNLKKESESYHLQKKGFYLYAPDGIGRSELADKLGQCIRVPMTARNWNTVKEPANSACELAPFPSREGKNPRFKEFLKSILHSCSS